MNNNTIMYGSNTVDSSQGTITPSSSDSMVRKKNLGTAGQEGSVVSATATMTTSQSHMVRSYTYYWNLTKEYSFL